MNDPGIPACRMAPFLSEARASPWYWSGSLEQTKLRLLNLPSSISRRRYFNNYCAFNYVIDEIGKMELLSQKFRTKAIDLLAQPSNILATIAKKGKGFIEQIKARNDIERIEVTRENRDQLFVEIAKRINGELGT
jgi:NTPase